MTNEQINIAIAEAMGWKFVENDPDYEPYWEDPSGYKTAVGLHKRRIPDYCNDLNAMHEVENTLIFSERKLFRYCLQKVKGSEFGDSVAIALDECVHATASQRAEAFLRTIGKWEDEK